MGAQGFLILSHTSKVIRLLSRTNLKRDKRGRICMHTIRQGKAHQGVVELAYEVIHPLEEERDTPGINFVGGWGENG
jgi:hypothetical protein